MATDEELLKPCREHLAMLRAEIQRQEALAANDIERYGYGDREYATSRWHEFHITTEVMYRQIEAVVKIMADYYGNQPLPPQILTAGQSAAGPSDEAEHR